VLQRGGDFVQQRYRLPFAAVGPGRPPSVARQSMTEFTRACLPTKQTPGRYSLHDLLRSYAADLTRTTDRPSTRRTATARLLDHYTHTAYAAARIIDPLADPVPPPPGPPTPGTSLEHLGDQRQAVAWLAAEHIALLAVQQHAANTGFDTHAVHLASGRFATTPWRRY
jgi:hypothetical protein